VKFSDKQFQKSGTRTKWISISKILTMPQKGEILQNPVTGVLRERNGVSLDFERTTIAARASISFVYHFGNDIFHTKKLEHSTEKQEN
jgi:hypothetical protein